MKKIFTLCAALIAGAAFVQADEIIININGQQVKNGETVTVNTLEQEYFGKDDPDWDVTWGWEKFQVEPETCTMSVISDNGGELTSELIFVSNDVDSKSMIQCCGKFFGNCYSVSSSRTTTGEMKYTLAKGENDMNFFLPGSKNGLQLEWQLSSLPSDDSWKEFIKPGDKAEAKFKFATANTKFEFNVVFVFPDSSAVEGIEAENGLFDIYSIDGSLVRRNASDLTGLDKGIYIAGGKKVLVK